MNIYNWVLDYFIEDMVKHGTLHTYTSIVKAADKDTRIAKVANMNMECINWLISEGLIELIDTDVYRIVEMHKDGILRYNYSDDK